MMKIIGFLLVLSLMLMLHEIRADVSLRKKVKSAFKCPPKPGVHYYADVSTGCQVFYLCSGTRTEGLLCSSGMIFNEKIGACDFPSNVQCKSPYRASRPSNRKKILSSNVNDAFQNTQVDENSISKAKTESPISAMLKELGKSIRNSKPQLEEKRNHDRPTSSSVSKELPYDKSEKTVPSEGVQKHDLESGSESGTSSRFPENDDSSLSDIVEPIISSVVLNRSTLHDIRRALLSGLVEMKPIVLELLHIRASREKRSISQNSEIDIHENEIPPKLQGSESEMLAIESETIQKFEKVSHCFEQLAEIISTDEDFALAVIDELLRIIETEGLLDDLEELFQLPPHQMRRKRFVNLNSPIVLPRELVENVKAGLQARTKPIIKDILGATLPTALRVASENVPLLIDVVDNLKPLLKDRFPTLLQHTASLVTKYDRYKYSNPGRITLPPPAEMISDFIPYALVGLEMGGEYMRKNPNAISTLFFGRNGMLSKIFSTNHSPTLRAVQQQSVPVSNRYQPRPSVSSAQYQRMMDNTRHVSSRFSALGRG